MRANIQAWLVLALMLAASAGLLAAASARPSPDAPGAPGVACAPCHAGP